MTIVEYFKPIFKTQGFRKKGKTFVKELDLATQFVTFQRMTSFDDHYMRIGVAYKNLPSNFVIKNAEGCPVEADALTLASCNGFNFSKADFNSNINVAKVEIAAEVVMPLIDDWFAFWSDPDRIRNAKEEELIERRLGVTIWTGARKFLGVE